MFSFFMVSVVGVSFCVHTVSTERRRKSLRKNSLKEAISIVFAPASLSFFATKELYLFKRWLASPLCSLSRAPLASCAQCVLQALARAIDAGLHRLRADAEKLRALLLRTAFDGK